jgi:hypothetical protein
MAYNARRMLAEVIAAKNIDKADLPDFLLDYIQFLMDHVPGQASQFESYLDDVMAEVHQEGEVVDLPPEYLAILALARSVVGESHRDLARRVLLRNELDHSA